MRSLLYRDHAPLTSLTQTAPLTQPPPGSRDRRQIARPRHLRHRPRRPILAASHGPFDQPMAQFSPGHRRPRRMAPIDRHRPAAHQPPALARPLDPLTPHQITQPELLTTRPPRENITRFNLDADTTLNPSSHRHPKARTRTMRQPPNGAPHPRAHCAPTASPAPFQRRKGTHHAI
jgi:hypothetical protein